MKMILSLTGAAVLAAALATSAAAVTVEPGAYVFQAADTTQMTMTVSIDSMGNTAITGLGIGFSEPCKVTATETPYTLQTAWGFGGDYVIGTNGKVTFTANDNYFTFDVTLTFGANGTATGGFITSYGATLYPENPFSAHPTHALLCVSPRQATTFVSYTPPAAEPQAPSAEHTSKTVRTAE